MNQRRITVPRGQAPLGVRDGLTATRARVPEDHAGMSAFDFVWHLVSTQRHRHPEDDEQAVLDRFAQGHVIIGPKFRRAEPTEPLAAGEDVWFYRTPAPEPQAPYACEVIFEDDDLLVVDKPPFMATMPRGMHITQTVTVQMRRSTGNAELTPAHRLDRNTAGILIMTKRRELRGRYQTLFARREVHKTYHAVAALGSTTAGTLWRSRMEKVAGEVQGRIVDGEPNAETLVADVRPLDAEQQAAMERMHGPLPALATYVLQPHTGKTHQLRLHMLQAGHPIVGDPAYPRVYRMEEQRFDRPMHLLAAEIAFCDPITGALRTFASRRHVVTMH